MKYLFKYLQNKLLIYIKNNKNILIHRFKNFNPLTALNTIFPIIEQQ